MTEQEAYQNALVQQTEVQNYLIANAESDIRIVRHQIDGMKEGYRQFDDEADFAERLENLYTKLANHEHRLAIIKMHPYNSSSWEVSEINSDQDFAVGYEVDYDAQLDKLNRDL